MIGLILFLTLLLLFGMVEFFCISFGFLIPVSLIVLFYFARSREFKLRWIAVLFGAFAIDIVYFRAFPWTLFIFGIYTLFCVLSKPPKRPKFSPFQTVMMGGILTALVIIQSSMAYHQFSMSMFLTLLSQVIFSVTMIMILILPCFRLFDFLTLWVGMRYLPRQQVQLSAYDEEEKS